MKRADEAIDQVLGGLRAIEAAPGLEGRVIAGMRRRAAGKRTAASLNGSRWVAACCGGLVLVGIGFGVRRAERRDGVATRVVGAGDTGVRAGRGQVGAVEGGVAQRLEPRSGVGGRGTAQAVSIRGASAPGRVPDGYSVRSSGVDRGRSSEAASMDVRAEGGSFPAAALPLTAQEKMLLRAARRGEPEPARPMEITVLPSGDALETAEFVEFFGPDRRPDTSATGESE